MIYFLTHFQGLLIKKDLLMLPLVLNPLQIKVEAPKMMKPNIILKRKKKGEPDLEGPWHGLTASSPRRGWFWCTTKTFRKFFYFGSLTRKHRISNKTSSWVNGYTMGMRENKKITCNGKLVRLRRERNAIKDLSWFSHSLTYI